MRTLLAWLLGVFLRLTRNWEVHAPDYLDDDDK